MTRAERCGAVRGRVIIAEDVEVGSPADGDLGDVGHQVIGDTLRVFADLAAFMGAYQVEVTQARNAPVGLGVIEVGQDVFDDDGGSVGLRLLGHHRIQHHLLRHRPDFLLAAVAR